jgi:response regulator NasT
METNLRVLIADEDEDALEVLRATLDELGHEVMPFAVSVSEAAELISREDPNLTIVMVHQDDEHALSLISEAVEFASGPVIATVRDGDADFLARAAEHGIAAYVQGTDPEAVQGAIEVALRRYRETAHLAGKVDQLEGALQRRVVIERAKGILMERHSPTSARRSSCCARTRGRTRGGWSRWRSRWSTGTRCSGATGHEPGRRSAAPASGSSPPTSCARSSASRPTR